MHQTKIDTSFHFRVNSEVLEEQIKSSIENYLKKMKKGALRYIFTYLVLIGIFIILSSGLIISLTGWVSPILTAVTLSLLMLTCFGSFLFHRYINLGKTDKYRYMAKSFGETCCQFISYPCKSPQKHSTMALAYALFADALCEKEYTLLFSGAMNQKVFSIFETLSASIFWQDIFFLRESLLLASIEEYLNLVKSDPLHLTYHTQLANAYILLSRVYSTPAEYDGLEEKRRLSKARFKQPMEDKYRLTTEKAIEEFRIISSYAPEDPWVHTQLAISYRDLDLPLEEIHACEALLKLCPTHKETLHRLGVLYFQLGANAKGLEVYKQLSRLDHSLASSLISCYGRTHLI